MLKTLKTYVRIQYNYAKKTNHYDTIQAHFHNAYDATTFAMDMAQTQDEYHAIEKFWEEWKEKFDDHLWNTFLLTITASYDIIPTERRMNYVEMSKLSLLVD